MADVITRLKIESGEYDSKIKRAVSGLQNMEQECRRVNGTLAKLEQDQKQFVQSLGQMQTVSNTVRGKIGELSGAFVELRAQYNRLTEEEKKGDYGKALSKSLDQLKQRISDSKKELSDIQQELNGGTSKFGDFGKVIDTVGNRLGVSGSLTEMLISKTAMLTAGVGAGIAIVGEATKAWMSYNAELAKQDQITKVTTGLEGPDSNRMTDAARAMADVYKVDFREAINAANTLMTQFGKTGDEAIQLLRDGMQGMVMGDGQKLLNMIKQYAPAFRDAGISASQLVAIIQNSEGGIFTDQNMNAIVMGIKNIRLMTNQTSEALAKLGIDGQDMTKKLNDGTMTIFDALKQVMGALQNVGSGSQAAGEVMQTVFGRQGVSAGTNLAKAIESLNTNLQETKRQTGEVGEAYDDLLRSTEKLNTAIREAFGYNGWEEMATGIKSKLITALADVLTLLNKIRDYDMPDWLKGPGDKPKPYSGTKVDTDYITRGTSAADREKRYTTVTGNINKKLQNLNAQEAALGKPYTYTDKNGGLVEQIDTPEEIAQKRRQIQSSRQILTRRLNTIQSQHDTLTAEPVRANTTPPKTGGSGSGGTTTKGNTTAKDVYVPAEGSIDAQVEKVRELTKQWSAATDQAGRDGYKKQLDEAQGILDQMRGKVKTVTQEMSTGISGLTPDMIKWGENDIKQQMQSVEYGTQEYNDLAQRLIDYNSVSNLMQEAVKTGLEVDDSVKEYFVDALTGPLGEKIPQELYDSLVESLNEFKEYTGDNPIELDAKTGNVNEKKTEKKEDDTLKETQKVVSGLSQVASGLQAMGIMLPSEVTKVLSMLQGAMTVVQGVGTIISVFGSTAESANTAAVGANTGALIANTAAMVALQAAMDVNTASNFIPFFAEGGVVPKFSEGGVIPRLIGKAADGMLIPGNSYSGDRLRMPVDGGRGVIGVNSGELILNMSSQDNLAGMFKSAESLVGTIRDESMALGLSQVGILADALDNEGSAVSSTPYVTGEQIFLGLNNFTKANGYGEIVTSRR